MQKIEFSIAKFLNLRNLSKLRKPIFYTRKDKLYNKLIYFRNCIMKNFFNKNFKTRNI